MPLTHVVVRRIPTNDGTKIAGELVDVTTWDMPPMRLRQLEDQRRLSRIPADVTPVPTVDGRFWESTEWPKKYGLQMERPPRKAEVAGRAPEGRAVSDREASAPADIDATPAALRLAKERDIDLASVEGTGAGGRITKPDVERLIEG